VYRPFTEYSESGVLGNPSAGTAAKGQQLFDRLGEKLVALLREIHANNSTPA
jgi:creatinine amidohydrolase